MSSSPTAVHGRRHRPRPEPEAGGGRRLPAGARAAGLEPGLYENATFSPEHATFPNSCHVCEVEIDPETGAARVLSYLVVDDVGTVINPLT